MSVSDEQIGIEAGAEVRAEVINLLKDKGPKLERVLLRLRQALNAKETKFFQFQGMVTDQRDVIDHKTRLTAAKLSLNLWDAMPSQKHEHTGRDGEPIEIIVTKDD